MAAYTGYNLEDAQVRQLINDRHTISEQRVESDNDVSLTVICCQCKSVWPCQIITDLRAWVVAHPGV